eukprot:CAMPEP_0184647606 /NCGR_PEP_ID=MMETSP0308-20130426/4578_1 /TAXON_ID=38269 /ORGANISM="Gloeochaete witrockiana, Strain SAG 46.84" /LENGTH=160 /DNA_ID=CAMNT_0027078729 /DNA_START=207 /DNA_END=689 /DNA_ORIENTATION=-
MASSASALASTSSRAFALVSSRSKFCGTRSLFRQTRLFSFTRERVPSIRAEDETPTAPTEKPFVEQLIDDLVNKKPKEILADASARPLFYLKNVALFSVAFFILISISSISSGLQKIPLLPNFFQLVGFGYVAFFAYKYLLFADSRAELKKIVDEFIGKL